MSRPPAHPPAAGREQAGFTLLEAVVALAVLGLAVVGATEAASRTLRTQALVSRRAEAVALADAALDEAILMDRDSLPRRADGAVEEVESVRLAAGRYRVATWARPADGGEGRIWRLGARVTWSDGRLELTTVVFRPDPSPPAGAGP